MDHASSAPARAASAAAAAAAAGAASVAPGGGGAAAAAAAAPTIAVANPPHSVVIQCRTRTYVGTYVGTYAHFEMVMIFGRLIARCLTCMLQYLYAKRFFLETNVVINASRFYSRFSKHINAHERMLSQARTAVPPRRYECTYLHARVRTLHTYVTLRTFVRYAYASYGMRT